MEIVNINLENEMDLILSHKRSMKLAELCGLSVLVQTSFATAVSEIARCVIGREGEKHALALGINVFKNNKKELMASINVSEGFELEFADALKYAKRLTSSLKLVKHKKGVEINMVQTIQFSGLINDAKLDSFINYFKKELPLSPYDELRKKNIQLLEVSEKLRDSENQYRLLTETLPLMMFTTNAGGFLTYGSKWLKDFFKLAEIPAGRLAWTGFVEVAENKNVRDDWEKAMIGQSPFSAQARLRSKGSNELLWHLISVIPVKNETGHVESWTGFFVDIHAQKLVEEALKNNKELKEAQKQLLKYQGKLEEKVEELKKSNHDLAQFAYIASHDLQEPLRKIRNFSELLDDNIQDPVLVKKYAAKIDQSSARMLSLIKDVLNYSRLTKAESTFVNTDLKETVKNVMLDMELLISEKHARINFDKLPVINGIPQQLYQLFYNFVSNSLKFCNNTPEITISYRPLPAAGIKSYDGLQQGKNYVELMFRDNGIGFDEKYARQVFTIFKRLHGRDAYPGSGIGLALCKRIVDNHQGAISVKSEVNKGTEFSVILPVE